MFLFSFRGSQHSRMILRHLLRQRNLLPVCIQKKSTHNPNKIRLILPFLIYVCYVFNTKIRNYLPNWYQKTCFYFHRYGLPSYSGHSSILKKIACKHTTYRLSQSPFFPLYQGGNLRFPVPAGTLAVHPCHQAIYTSYKEHFPIQIQYRQVPISHSTMFLRISPTIVGFIWVSALFRCEDNFFMLLL